MDKAPVAAQQLLPAHQQTPRVIEPTMQSLDHPAARLLGRIETAGKDPILAHWTDMRGVAARIELVANDVVVVGFVQTDPLRLRGRWGGTSDGQRVQGTGEQFHIGAVGSGDDHGQRQAVPLTQRAALGPLFAAIRWIATDPLGLGGRDAPDRGFGQRPIHAEPR